MLGLARISTATASRPPSRFATALTVADKAVGLRLDERRATSAARPCDGSSGDLSHGPDILPIYRFAGHGVGGGTRGDVLVACGDGDGSRGGVQVVLADEQHRQT